MYKLPKDSTHKGTKTKSDGLDYVYITANTVDDDSWIESQLKIDDVNSMPGRTITQIYQNADNVALMYNDEPPTTKVDNLKGHTKGVMASDARTGFWLVHSVPHFPPNIEDGEYGYPATGHLYGQSFLCITMNSEEVNKAGEQLLYNEPHIYSSQAPENLENLLPNLFKAINNETIKMAPFWNEQEFSSLQNTVFRSFAKTRHFGKDLYEDWLAPALKTDLVVETWQHGTGNMPSNCTLMNKVMNVDEIEISAASYDFPTLKDHSKWAVSASDDSNWICVGDINRQEHQKQRGGGTVCQNHKKMSKFYRNLVKDVEPCPKEKSQILVIF
ncbi:deoxyribonuclease-2-alpha-like isoform X2 [Culicoides brevitarsis]